MQQKLLNRSVKHSTNLGQVRGSALDEDVLRVEGDLGVVACRAKRYQDESRAVNNTMIRKSCNYNFLITHR